MKQLFEKIYNIRYHIFIFIYLLNAFYFSLNTFISSHVGKPNIFFIFPNYKKMLYYNKYIGNVAHVLKLSTGYSFFGKGLSAPIQMKFDYLDSKKNIISERDFSTNFVSANGNLRANTIKTRIYFSLVNRIRILNDSLNRVKNNNSDEKSKIKREIIKTKNTFNNFMVSMGTYTGRDVIMKNYFRANIYFLKPNELYTHQKRKLVLYDSLTYNYNTKKIN